MLLCSVEHPDLILRVQRCEDRQESDVDPPHHQDYLSGGCGNEIRRCKGEEGAGLAGLRRWMSPVAELHTGALRKRNSRVEQE